MLVGERLVLRAHGQREGHGLAARSDARAGVDVEDRAVLEVFPAAFKDTRRHLSCRDTLVADHGDIAADGGEARQRLVDGKRRAVSQDHVKAQLGAVKSRVHAVVFGHGRVDLPEHADPLLAEEDLRAAAGMVGRVVAYGREARLARAEAAEQLLDPALEREEVHPAAVCAERDDLRLVRKAVGALEIDLADLVEGGRGVAEVVVARQDLQHRGQHRRAHDRGILAQRIEDPQAVAQRRIRGEADLVVIARGDEGIGDDLVKPETAADLADAALAALLGGKAAAGRDRAGEARGDLVVAVEARDLLGDVGIVLDVAAPRGHKDRVALEAEAELREDIPHGLLVDVGAEQGVDLLRLKLERHGLQLAGHGVDHAGDDLARAEQLDQLAGALERAHRVHHVQSLFETRGRVRAHAQRRGRAAHGGAGEIGALEEDHGRVAHDLAVRAAHHARDGNRLFGVADAEHILAQRARVAVERCDALARSCAADADLAVLHAGEIKGVHRLAVLEHDVVRDVDNVVDRAHAGGADPFAHPCRRGGDPDVAHHARGVARAELAVLDDDLGQLRDIALPLRRDLRLVEPELLAEGDGGLAREADHAQAVGAVGRDLKLDDMVVQPQQDADVLAGLSVAGEDQDAVGNAVRELLLLCAQVLERADRSARRVESDEVARVEVRAGREALARLPAEAERAAPRAVRLFKRLELRRADRAEELVPGLDLGRDRRLVRVERMIVAEDRGGRDNGLGEVVRGHAQLLERA